MLYIYNIYKHISMFYIYNIYKHVSMFLYLWSIGSQTRLTNLAILSIERNVAKTVIFEVVINDFAEKDMQNKSLAELEEGQDSIRL